MATLSPRQEELADAALALIARESLPAATFRAVAGEAECSLGSVQKAFPSKEALLSAAFARLRDQATPLPAAEPGRPTLHGWLVDLFIGVLPLDHPRTTAQRQSDAFTQWALTNPAAASAIASSDEEIRERIASLIRRAQQEGEVSAHVDAAATAWLILALAQGMAAQLLYDPAPEATVRRRLEGGLAALLA